MAICALHPQEAVGGVANPGGQHFVPEHGIDHGALPIARPTRKPSEAIAICISGCHLEGTAWRSKALSSIVTSAPTQAEWVLCAYENGWTTLVACVCDMPQFIMANQLHGAPVV